MLTQTVNRNWYQPPSVVVSKALQAATVSQPTGGGLTLVATGLLGPKSTVWNGVGQGLIDPFTGGTITHAQLIGVTQITVTITLTVNTSDQPFSIGVYDSAFNFYVPATTSFAAGETGTKTIDLPPAVVAALIASGNGVLGGLPIAPSAPSNLTTTTIGSGTVMFYK